MTQRVTIRWTFTAKEGLKSLPAKVAAGLVRKANQLGECDDPRKAFKPLTGPLANYYRISYGRYRAIYTVKEQELANGEVHIYIEIIFVAAGIRKEGDKKDVYRLAKKMLKWGGYNDIDATDDPELQQ